MITPRPIQAASASTPVPFQEPPASPADEVEPVLQACKLECNWPEQLDDSGVIDLDAEEIILSQWFENSEQDEGSDEEDDDSNSSSSETQEDFQTHFDSEAPAPDRHFAERCPKWYVNIKTMVLRETTSKDKFRCGRPVNGPYCPVQELHGFRCGRCFAA